MKQEKAYSIIRPTLTGLFVIVCLLYQSTFATPVQAGDSPASFGKASPLNGATDQPFTVSLHWNTSVGATSYQFCFAKTNACPSPSAWSTASSVSVTGLTPNTTYYWQIRAVNSSGITYADGGTWWSFTTLNPPIAFNKSSPANGALGQPIANLILNWTASGAATNRYDICFDTSDNNTCNAPTTYSTTFTFIRISGLTAGTTYYWQVFARDNEFNTVEADNNTWYSFTTATNFIYLPLVLR